MENRERPVCDCDIRFGSAGGQDDGPTASNGPAETVELSYGEWKAAVEAGSWPDGKDCCVRLGRRFARPAVGAEEARAYAADLAECRRLAGAAAGRGGASAYLLEFSPSFAYFPETRRHLDHVLKDLSGLPLVVAFLDASWYSSRVIEGLKARGVCLCLMDAPRQLFSPPSVDVVTAPLVYVKFYGRSGEIEEHDGGEGGALSSPRDYDYSDAELMAWLPRLEALAAQAETLRVVFAARRSETGARNARRLAELWRGRSGRSLDCEAARSESPKEGP